MPEPRRDVPQGRRPGTSSARRHRLTVVQRRLTRYRVGLFESLREQLSAHGVDLSLIVGDGTASEASRKDGGTIDWARRVGCTYAWGGRLCWQSLAKLLEGEDMVVVAQESKLLHNVPLLLRPQPFRVALWGHGRNFQGADHHARERFKRWLSAKADWWFAYTNASAAAVRAAGYPTERITVLNNAVDTVRLHAQVTAAGRVDLATRKRELGLPDGPVGLFVGSLYREKLPGLLIDAARRIRAARPDFSLVIAGAGPLSGWLAGEVSGEPWIHLLGPVDDDLKARWLAASDLLLNPGAVGLGILDAFAGELPMITTDCGIHGAEIAYLENGVNGMMVPMRAAAVARAALDVLADPELAQRLRRGCIDSATRYSLAAMVRHFVDGILQWRDARRFRSA